MHYSNLEGGRLARMPAVTVKLVLPTVLQSRHYMPTWARGVVVNMPPCHGGDRRFNSGRARQEK